VRLRKLAEDYDPSDRDRAYAYIRDRQVAGEVVTGLLYISTDSQDMHQQSGTVNRALVDLPYESLCPGSAELAKLQEGFR
jgi:2-oxoglutarate ferredoxin oxidoreductase subunit beta